MKNKTFIFRFLTLLLLSNILIFNTIAQPKFIQELEKGNPQTLIVYGTSIESADFGRIWVSKIGEEINSRYDNKLTLYNAGRSGQQSVWALENLQDSVLNRSPNALVIEFAANDAVSRFGISADSCRVNTLSIINRVLEKFPNCEIFLHTPCGYPLGINATNRPTLWDYNNVYKDISAEFGYPLINTAIFFKEVAEDPTKGTKVLKAYTADGVHPTEKGAIEVFYKGVLESLLTGQSVIMSSKPERYGTLLLMNPDYIPQSATVDMSSHYYPYDWTAAVGELWTSSNVFAQYFTPTSTTPHLGKCIRFGKTDIGVGTAKTHLLDLSAEEGEEVSLEISVASSGTNNTGTLNVFLDNSTVPLLTISAQNGNNGNPFETSYYTFQTKITGGTASSFLRFEHSKSNNGGNLFINKIEVVRSNLSSNFIPKSNSESLTYIIDNGNNIQFNQFVNISIYDIDGQQILTQHLSDSIDISKLNTGVYLIRIINQNGETLTSKFYVKQQ